MFHSDIHQSASAICAAEGWDYADLFHGQFRLSASGGAPCPTWDTAPLGAWQLHHCPSLPRHDLRLADGRLAGAVLGVAVDADGRLLSGDHQPDGADSIDGFERFIQGLAGRFLAVIVLDGAARVYFDPTGGLSAVYSESDRRLASSVHVLADRDLSPPPVPEAAAVLDRRAMFALGETCDTRCQRVFANHYLDLETFRLVRHWPGDSDMFDEEEMTRDQIAEAIATRLAAIMQALTGGYRCSLPLTGGTDSRILLSAAGGCLSAIDKFYIHHIRFITRFDMASAQAMADQVGVPLHVIDRRRDPAFMTSMTDAQVARLRRKMALRTSLTFDGLDPLTVRAVGLAPASQLILRGNAAEMSRANKWTRETATQGVTIRDGLATLLNRKAEDLPEVLPDGRYDDLMGRYEAWVQTLPEPARLRLPDLAHAELFMPAAPNNVFYAFDRSFYLNPYNDRRIIHLTARFNPLARRRRRLVKKIIGYGMPELNPIPYLGYFRSAHFEKAEA